MKQPKPPPAEMKRLRAAIKKSQKRPTVPYQRELRDTIYGPDRFEYQARKEQDEYDYTLHLIQNGVTLV